MQKAHSLSLQECLVYRKFMALASKNDLFQFSNDHCDYLTIANRCGLTHSVVDFQQKQQSSLKARHHVSSKIDIEVL
jgi:hypothetical protein